MRPVLALAVLSACSAKLHLGERTAAPDAPDSPDAAIHVTPDGAPDARACDGGDSHMVAPDGTCFVLFSTTPLAYADAQTACHGIGGHLAFLKTAALDAAAETFIGARDVYMGGGDAATEGTWLWDDGTPFSNTNWRTGEPNNANNQYEEDCLVIDGSRVGAGWDDRACADPGITGVVGQFAYLCQY